MHRRHGNRDLLCQPQAHVLIKKFVSQVVSILKSRSRVRGN